MMRVHDIRKTLLSCFAAALMCALLLLAGCAWVGDVFKTDADAARGNAGSGILDDMDDNRIDTLNITPKTDFARALAAGEIGSVLVIGDSISAGEGCDDYVEATSGNLIFADEEGSYFEPDPENGAWTNKLRAYCAAAGVSEFMNASIPGSSYSWLDQESERWADQAADAIIVMLGTNDASSYGEEELRVACESVLGQLFGRCSYLLVIAPPKNDRQDMPVLTDIATADYIIYDICAAHGYEFISSYWALEPGTPDYNLDQVHPTTEGSQNLWDYIADEIGLG